MPPVRRTATAALVALAAAHFATVPASAVTGHGLGGFVTDADTGLGLDQSLVTWNGTTKPAPQAKTDPSGRYLFLGLDAGSAGNLGVVGPPGWDRVTVGGMTLPADGLGTQNVAVHRDWSAAAGGARATANDDSGAAGGCAPAAAVDGDRATGWSVPATRPAADPATLTVELPQTIDVAQFALNAAAVCGHQPGSALGRYRLQTSADGASWATAAEGVLGAETRGADATIPPAANGSGVRFVRLVLLSAQDAGAATIDVGELLVYGVGPNVAPSGSVSIDAPRTYIKQIVRLRAAFTDPDSTIVRYLWDFDGDGSWEQATLGPSVSHVWAGPGAYHVTVGARDFRGALGTASIDLRITDPNVPLEPIPQRKPLITFDPPNGIDLATRIACASKCTFTAKMVLSARTARKLRLKRRAIFTMKRSTQGPGLGSWTLELPQTVVKRLRTSHMKSVKVRLTASAVDQERRRTTVHHWVTFR